MADTLFVNRVTPIQADWLNDVNDFVYSDPRTPFVVLAMGQSNMDGFTFASTGPHTVNPQVYLWDTNAVDNNNVIFGTQFNVGAFGTAPLNQTDSGTGDYVQSLAFECAKNLQSRIGRPVYVVQVAAGTHEIEQWISDATCTANGWTKDGAKSDLYDLMLPTGLRTALDLVPGQPATFDAIIWHQGESNPLDGPELYARKFRAMVDALDTNGVIDLDTTLIAVGELTQTSNNPNLKAHTYALRRIELDLPTARVVSSVGAATFSATNSHFTGLGILDMGKRYASALLSPRTTLDWIQTGPSMGAEYGYAAYTTTTDPDPTDRVPVTLSTTLQYKTTGVLGKSQYAAASTAALLYTRKIYRVPTDRVIKVTYELQVDNAGGSVDHRVVLAQYDINMAYMSNEVSTPSSSPASGVDGRVIVTRSYQKNGLALGADTTLDAGCEFVALGVNLGVGADDEPYYFNILELSV